MVDTHKPDGLQTSWETAFAICHGVGNPTEQQINEADKLISAYTANHTASLQHRIENLEAALKVSEFLLRTTANRVNNDNGDMGVNGNANDTEICDVYMAHKAIASALANNQTGE